MLLEGPYVIQSNRVIRQYQGFEDYFLRVDFRDEDRLQYRWDKDVSVQILYSARILITRLPRIDRWNIPSEGSRWQQAQERLRARGTLFPVPSIFFLRLA